MSGQAAPAALSDALRLAQHAAAHLRHVGDLLDGCELPVCSVFSADLFFKVELGEVSALTAVTRRVDTPLQVHTVHASMAGSTEHGVGVSVTLTVTCVHVDACSRTAARGGAVRSPSVRRCASGA
jgi:hypothetical protein